jgi:hypothetical protein
MTNWQNSTEPEINTSLMRALFQTSKVNAFFGFTSTSERPSIVGEVFEQKNYTIVRLELTEDEILKTRQENALFQKICEWLLFLYNHRGKSYYPNITFTPLIIHGHKFPSCILIFRGKVKSTGEKRDGYQTIKSITLNIDTRWPLDDSEYMERKDQERADDEYTILPPDKRVYHKVRDMLSNQSISVRKIFNIGMKQWQARLIYKTLHELTIFTIDTTNNNEKIYFPERYKELTQELITEIMNEENREAA